MRRLTVLWVILVAGLAFALAHFYATSHQPRADMSRDHASFRTNDWGTQALRTLLDRAGLKTASWRRPWTDLGDTPGVLWIIAPEKPISREEARALLAWVETGGVAVFAHDASGLRIHLGSGEAPAKWFLSWLGWEASGSGAQDMIVSASGTNPILRQVAKVTVTGSGRLRRSDTAKAEKPGKLRQVQAVIADGKGMVLGECIHGRGRVYLLCSADALGNKWIARTDNVILATNVAFLSPTGRVWFDEYHHGRVSASDSDLDTTAASRALWAIVAAFALFALGKFQRFGRPIPKPLPPRRAAVEYVRAFASIFERAQRPEAMLEKTHARFRSRLSQASGLPPSAPDERLARAVKLRNPKVDAAGLTRLLAECRERLASARPVTDQDLLGLTRAIARIEQELFDHDI